MRTCTLKERYIRAIIAGKKTKEARMATTMFKQWEVGDKVKFFSKRNPELYVVVVLTKKTHYSSVPEMLLHEGMENLLENVDSIKHATKIYRRIPNYRNLEEKYGVLAFSFDVVNYSN